MRHPQEAEKDNKRSSNKEKNKDNTNIQTTNYFSNQNIGSMSNETKPLVVVDLATETQDKRLQEMKEFALEYVKQIVLKANELSRERNESKRAAATSASQVQKQMEDVTKYNSNTNNNNKANFQVNFDGEKQKQDSNSSSVFLTPIEATDAISERLKLEAGEINKRFKLFTNRNEEIENNNKQQKRVDVPRQIHYERSNKKVRELVDDRGGNGTNDNPQQDHEQIVRNYQNTTFIAQEQRQHLGNSSQQAYVETGSILRNSQQPQRQKEKNQQQQQPQEKRSKRGFYHRLNWHLIVACFSTCLPQSMTETVPSSMSSGGTSRGGSASATAV